jgi:hypothetical protein
MNIKQSSQCSCFFTSILLFPYAINVFEKIHGSGAMEVGGIGHCVLSRNIKQQVNTQDLTLGLLQIVDKGTAKVLTALAHVIDLIGGGLAMDESGCHG